MKQHRARRAVAALLWVLLLLQALVGLSACASRDDVIVTHATEIASVELNKAGDRVVVTATLSTEDAAVYKNATVALFALEPFETTAKLESGAMTPVAESRGAESMRFSVDYYFDNGERNRLTQRFVLASRDENGVYHTLTDGVYISNPEILSGRNAKLYADTLKGVSISATDDVALLSPSHTVIDLPLEEYIQATPERSNTISYLYTGETLSLSESKIDALDEQIKRLSSLGALIYLRPVLTAQPDTLEGLSALGYEGSAEAKAYAINVENEEGYFYVTGFFRFLAERYPTVTGVIPGVAWNEAVYSSTSVGSFEEHVSSSLSLLRMAHNIFRSVNSGVQAYLPVTNLFTTDGALGATEHGSREFLGAFATYAKRSGDFDWSIYLMMSTPSTTTETIYTESGTVNAGEVTKKYIFPQTIALLTDLLSTQELIYGTTKRQMIWSLALPASSEAGMENQRVSLLYAYMKAAAFNAEKNGTAVRAVIWDSLSDTETSTAGLLRTDGRLKPAGELFASLGREDLALAIDLSGVEAKLGARYQEIESVLSDTMSALTVYSGKASGTSVIPENAQPSLLFGDTAGWGSAFSALPGSGVILVRRPSYNETPMLRATFESGLGCGVYTSSLYGRSLQGRDMLALSLSLTLPEGYSSADTEVILETTDENGAVLRYVGVGKLDGGKNATLVFDIEDFAKKIEDDAYVSLTLLLIGTGATEETPVTLQISRIEVFETRSWFMRGGWIIFLVAVILVALTVLLIWFFHNYEVRWTRGARTRRARKAPNTSVRTRLSKLFRSLTARTEVRPRSRSRIIVKPESMQRAAANPEEEKDSFDHEDTGNAETLEELFDETSASDE